MSPAAIRALRESRGESQTAFGAAVARALGRPEPYSRVTVTRWESGQQDGGIPWHLIASRLRPRARRST